MIRTNQIFVDTGRYGHSEIDARPPSIFTSVVDSNHIRAAEICKIFFNPLPYQLFHLERFNLRYLILSRLCGHKGYKKNLKASFKFVYKHYLLESIL